MIPGGPRTRAPWHDSIMHSFSDGRHVIYASCNGAIRGVSPEDVRALPKSEVAADAVKNQLGCASPTGNTEDSYDNSNGNDSLPILVPSEHDVSSNEAE